MNQPLVISTRQCDGCGQRCWPGDRFCSHCGVSLVPASIEAPGKHLVDTSRRTDLAGPRTPGILDNRRAVLCVLFFAGPMGLPLLWFSPRFSCTFKVLTTIFYFTVTVLIPLGIAYYFLGVSVQPLLKALR